MVPTVWGVNYSGEERRPAAGEGGEGRGGTTPAFWTSWRLPPGCRPPRTSPAACRGRPGSSGWWSPWGCGDKEDDVIPTPGRGRGTPPPPVPHRPVHFTSLVPAAVLSERGTVLLLPLEDKPPPEDETRVPPRLATGTPLNAVSAHLALFLSLFGVHPYRFVLICRGNASKTGERENQTKERPSRVSCCLVLTLTGSGLSWSLDQSHSTQMWVFLPSTEPNSLS